MNLLPTALEYYNKGFHVIPIQSNKLPACKEWKKYQYVQTQQDIESLFSGDHYGIALVMTEGLEALDFDTKNDTKGRDLVNKWWEELKGIKNPEPIINSLWRQNTPSGGAHILFRSLKQEGNQKLAKDGKATIIETRGLGGYIAIYPTPGYEAKSIPDFPPHIDTKYRDSMLTAARTFDSPYIEEKKQDPKPTVTEDFDLQSKFNADHGWQWIVSTLESHGWSVASETQDTVLVTRPDKSTRDGHSADIQKESISRDGTNTSILYVFSSNAWPFQEERAYDPYGVFSLLECGGDWAETARVVRRMYPDNEYKPDIIADSSIEDWENDPLLKKVLATQFDINTPPPDREAVISWVGKDFKEWDLAYAGSIVYVKGPQKSGKSLLTTAAIANAIGGNKFLGLKFNNPGGDVLVFDTEQEDQYAYDMAKKACYMNGYSDQNPPNFYHFRVREESPKDRRKVIYTICTKVFTNVKAVFIDGIVDLCDNFNDIEKSQDLVQLLMNIGQETGAITWNIIHTNKHEGFARGHLGSILAQKAALGLSTKQDLLNPENFIVECSDSRGKPFPTFAIRRDENRMGIPVDAPDFSIGVKIESYKR